MTETDAGQASTGEAPTREATATLLPGDSHEVAALRAQVLWFNRLRLVVAASVIWLTALAAHGFAILPNPWPLYVVGGLIAVVDFGYIAVYRRLARWSLASVRQHVYLQIGVDLLLLTALLHWSGGVTNPVALFYLFHAFIAALVLSVRAAVIVGFSSLILLAGLGFAEHFGWLAHHPLPLGLAELDSIEPLGFLLLTFAYGGTLIFSIYFVANVLSRLGERERQLLRLTRQLATSEKLASVGTLAAGVSHEINNPIGVIANKVQILRYRVADGDEPEQLCAELDVIDKHTRRIAKITAGLLTFSRDTPFEMRPLDVDALLREAADLVKVPFRTAGVALVCEPRPIGEATIQGSSNHLLQVLINMLLNAKDASPAGAFVRLENELSGGELHLRVIDAGAGIELDNLAKVFDPFFTTKDVDKGTGLGLAISHGIVERHGGRIEIDSQPGRGTTFHVVLPLA
ncbi:MAG: ATP-binding protein [bacterium]|nr:ATP-binding protein [bacterium]